MRSPAKSGRCGSPRSRTIGRSGPLVSGAMPARTGTPGRSRSSYRVTNPGCLSPICGRASKCHAGTYAWVGSWVSETAKYLAYCYDELIFGQMAPGLGFEPRTDRLTADCSTAELPRTRAGRLIADRLWACKASLTLLGRRRPPNSATTAGSARAAAARPIRASAASGIPYGRDRGNWHRPAGAGGTGAGDANRPGRPGSGRS